MPPDRPVSRRWMRMGALVLVLAAVVGIWMTRKRKLHESSIHPTNALQLLVRYEGETAAEHWKIELDAQQRGRVVTRLWDAVNHSTNKLAKFFSEFSPTEMRVPIFNEPEAAPHSIRLFHPASSRALSGPEWRQLGSELIASGWELERCEFRHIGISPDTFYVSAHLLNPNTATRAIVEGSAVVEFGNSGQPFARVDASRLELRTRTGAPAFSEMLHAELSPPSGSYFIDPLIIWDLDLDGQLEVILAAANVVFRRSPDGRWSPSPLCEHDPGLIFTAILGDFSGNSTTDFLCVKFEGLILYEGSSDGRFLEPGRLVWAAQPRLRYPQAFTAGDIDRDGDLDLFLGQYKVPFEKGQMPFPYFDANDGYPSFLLENNGAGNFADITQKAGLSAKRARRVYSSSLVDLDTDGDLDLVVVSDFAGLDAFENDGAGKYSDATKKWFDETRALGMAHSFADFNRDGRLDILMIGMNSPTADRLNSMNLARPYERPDAGMRAATTFGNRLYYGQSDGTFRQNILGAQIARTGWSWGAAAGDLDNDGFPDLFIANGHATRASTEDYEPEFWLHDIYIGTSQENSLADSYFRQKLASTQERGVSYGGYEKNRLFLNLNGTNFIEVAHLFGVGMEQDSRNVAAQDLDGDGRLDLIVTTFEAYPQIRQSIRFFRNELESTGRSVEVLLSDLTKTGAAGQFADGTTNDFAIVSGESYRTQLPQKVHVGLGRATAESAQILKGTNHFRVVRSKQKSK